MNFSVPSHYKSLLALFFLLVTASSLVSGQSVPTRLVGKVLYTNGLVTLAGKNTPLQIIAKGQSVYTRDRVATGLGSKAIIKLLDGSQISLIENTEFLISRFSIKRSEEHAELQLLRGGIRSVSGFINKFANNQFNLLTPIGNVAIRGTDFTAFLCTEKCQGTRVNNSSTESQVSKLDKSLVKGRLIMKTGEIKAREASGQLRILYDSSPIYSGDIISSAKNSMMVAVFKDDTRVTLNSNSIFQVGNYQYLPTNLADNNVVNNTANNNVHNYSDNYAGFKLLQGSIRFLAGDIARLNKQNFVLSTPQHSIRLDNAGIDLAIYQATNIAVWKGAINFVFANDIFNMQQGDKYLIAVASSVPEAIQNLPSIYFQGQRPDSSEIEQAIKNKNLFDSSVAEGKAGLYLYVKNGEIEAKKGALKLNLGSGEVGFLGDGSIYRLINLPDFLITQFLDPRVNQKTLNRLNLLPDLNIADPDGPICEI